jgi:hypothetical protein
MKNISHIKQHHHSSYTDKWAILPTKANAIPPHREKNTRLLLAVSAKSKLQKEDIKYRLFFIGKNKYDRKTVMPSF